MLDIQSEVGYNEAARVTGTIEQVSFGSSMPVTIDDVARLAGVSKMTVSRVINGSQRVSTETRRRVEQAIAELDYVPNVLARGLSRRKAGTLALIVPDIANPFFTLIVRGAEDVARRNGYRMILCNTESDLDREHEYLQEMLAHRVEGLLIAPASDLSRRHVRQVEQHNVPFVLLDRSIAGLECDIVQGDSVGGARRLTGHLLDLGHRQIAMISGQPHVSTSRDRVRGYYEALELAGLSRGDAQVLESHGSIAGGYQAARRLFQLVPQPTAVFVVDNLVALGVIQALRERGLSIPNDIALACFDDIEQAAIICPFLTVMAQPAETFGTLATQLLLERINGRAPERPRRIVLAPELIVRESCGAPPATTPSRKASND
jgi:LacI family transcriptional regulator